MRLIIKDYLLQLKEKDELDLLLCDLLLQMGYTTHNKPKTGNRQYGVDIRATTKEEILLCVVKQGDINRKNWDSGQNAVRQSLNEIHDCYQNFISGKDRTKRIRIAVIANGIMDEAVLPNWEGYKQTTNWDKINVEIEFWDIDILSECVHKYLLNERVFDKDMQGLMRRALYYVSEPDYRRDYYEKIIDAFIEKLKNEKNGKARNKILFGVALAGQMIAYYAADCGIYKIGIQVSEYLIIRYWQYMMENKYLGQESHVKWLLEYKDIYEKWNEKYHESIKFCCEGKNMLFIANHLEQRIMVYEMLGYLTSYAYYLVCNSITNCNQKLISIVNTITMIINNCPQIFYPLYDVHIGVISMLYRLLLRLDRREDVLYLLKNHCVTLYKYFSIEKKYPSPIDSFEDAVNIELGLPAEEYDTSAFWGTMLVWIVLLEQSEVYDLIQKFLSKDLSNVTKCIWIPKLDEELKLYDAYAMNFSGIGISVDSKDTFDEIKENILPIIQQYQNEGFSYDIYSFEALEFITSRYYGYIVRIKDETPI